MHAEQASLERYRIALDPLRRLLLIAVPVVLGVLAGVERALGVADLAAVAQRQPVRDHRPPVRHGRVVLRVHAAVPAVRARVPVRDRRAVVRRRGRRALPLRRPPAAVAGRQASAPPPARTCPSLLGVFVLLKAVGVLARPLRPGRHARTASCTGLTYTDVNAVLPGEDHPALRSSLICAVLFFVERVPRRVASGRHRVRAAARHVRADRRRLPGARAAVPGASERGGQGERRTSSATSTRRGRRTTSTDVDDRSSTRRSRRRRPRRWQQARARSRTSGCRPAVVGADVPQLQQIRAYYGVPRHPRRRPLPAQRQAARRRRRGARAEPERHRRRQRNWVNDHLVYTHGYGVVAAYGNTATSDGKPQFFESGHAADGPARRRSSRGSTSARTRRSTRSSARPPARRPVELDYPDDERRAGPDEQHATRAPAASPVGSAFRTGCCTR